MKKFVNHSLQTGYSCLGKNGQLPSTDTFAIFTSTFWLSNERDPMAIIAPSAKSFAMVMRFAEMDHCSCAVVLERPGL